MFRGLLKVPWEASSGVARAPNKVATRVTGELPYL